MTRLATIPKCLHTVQCIYLFKIRLIAHRWMARQTWYYADPKAAASNIKGYYAFWKGDQVA